MADTDNRAERVAELAERYGQDIYRLCRMYLQDASLAQDAAQETFFKAFRHYDRFRHEASEKTWLITICVRTCRNMLRSPWHRFVDRSVVPEDLPLAAQDTGNEVLRAVLQLPFHLRVVTVLHYYYGYKAREIGDMLHVPTNTVLTRLRRSREKLKSMLQEGGEM